jgi:hypothetical protein
MRAKNGSRSICLLVALAVLFVGCHPAQKPAPLSPPAPLPPPVLPPGQRKSNQSDKLPLTPPTR